MTCFSCWFSRALAHVFCDVFVMFLGLGLVWMLKTIWWRCAFLEHWDIFLLCLWEWLQLNKCNRTLLEPLQQTCRECTSLINIFTSTEQVRCDVWIKGAYLTALLPFGTVKFFFEFDILPSRFLFNFEKLHIQFSSCPVSNKDCYFCSWGFREWYQSINQLLTFSSSMPLLLGIAILLKYGRTLGTILPCTHHVFCFPDKDFNDLSPGSPFQFV